MIKNYLKISFRYLQRHKEHSIINIFGLAVSVTCCILIMMFVRSEVSYDAFHSKADRVYRVWQREKINDKTFDNVVTPLVAAGAIKSSFPEVESSCRIYNFKPVIKIDRSTFTENVDMVDPSFFKMFDFGLIKGDPEHAFATDNSVILTAAAAKKYFGTNSAIGKNIEVQLGDDKVLFTVSGVVDDIPEASSIQYQILMPFANATHLFRPQVFTNWFNVFSETYVLLKPGANAPALEKKFPAMMKQQLGADFGKEDFNMHLQNIKDIHLDTALPAGNEPISDPKYAYILGTIGVLILVIACINFITLSIGRSTKRAMEVGVRKALGAERRQLVFQFWGEAFLLVLCSVVIGVFLAAALLKPFDTLVSKQLSFHADVFFILFCLLLVGFIAIISGIYPAMILSGFKPVEVLKGKINVKAGSGWLHKGLVVGQFTTSVVMIIGTIIIGQQMKYLQTKDLGYKKDQVVVVSTNKSLKEGIPLANLYRNELVKHAQVINASVSVYSFAETPWVQLGYTDEKKQYKTIQYNAIDANFITEMGIKLLSGRNFVTGNTNDLAGTAIVNEAYVKAFNLADAIGKKLPGPFPQEIIGVVKDFNFESLHTKVQPLVMSVDPLAVIKRASDVNISSPPQPRISVLLKAGNLSENIDVLKKTWASVAPGTDFEYRFLDESIAAQYKQEQRTNLIVQIASGLSIFIACLGLFGLATLSVVKRIKEIGIRKVLGASVGSIVQLLSREFIILVLIASVIASPIAWWAMNKWLQDFTYRVNISFWAFIFAGLAAVLIALVTVSYHAIKAALVNPVKSLKTE